MIIGSKITKELLTVDLKYPENQIVVLEEGIDYWFTNDSKKLNLIKEQLWKKKEKENNENSKEKENKNEEDNQNKESQKEHKKRVMRLRLQ